MRIFIFISVLGICWSCKNSTENEKLKRFDSGAIIYDYKIWGEEGSDSVTVLLQYHTGDEESLPKALDKQSKVMLDDRKLEADSAKLTGVYYEVVLPAKNFGGVHTIVVTDASGEQHIQKFSFIPFSLEDELPAQIKKEPFTFRLSGINKEPTNMRLVMIDTAFSTPDVNEELLIENGEVTITPTMWGALATGPIKLELYAEKEILLKKGPKEEGRLVMTYGLKREFEYVAK